MRFARFLVPVLLVWSHTSNAATISKLDRSFIARVSFSCSSFELPDYFRDNVSVLSLSASLAARYRNIYGVASLADSLTTANVLARSGAGDPVVRGTASRRDVDLLLGFSPEFLKSPGRFWSLYAGIKSAETSIDYQNSTGTSGTRLRYKYDGPFAGINHTWKLPEFGRVTVGAAYTRMSLDDEIDSPVLELRDQRVTGYSQGVSYSILWKFPINAVFSFDSSIKYNSYKLDLENNVLDGASDRLYAINFGVTAYY